jgi:rhodanese-related sulfurtransferase
MRRLLPLLAALLMFLPVSLPAQVGAATDDIPRMTREELVPLLGSADVIVIDVRANPDWLGSDVKIKGAVREDPAKLATWIEKYPKDKTLVFY